MSYLGALRLHFAGQFQAAPSTVNNLVAHFDNATFAAEDRVAPGGWWNPTGSANWRLAGCAVTAAWHGDGSPADPADPVTTCLVADSDRAAPAKLVDLDPEQQMVSQVWGLEVRICDRDGTTLVRGTFEPVAFMDIWDRAPGAGGDVGAGAMYQSVLSELEWGDVAASPLLSELRAAVADGLLSIKFNVDGYAVSSSVADFTYGRIVGTIGPAAAGEPHHFVAGRQLMARAAPGGNFFKPAGKVNFCVAAVDEAAGKVHLDLGNALPGDAPGGPPSDIGSVALACGGPQGFAIGEVQYRQAGWYERTGGVVTLPAGRALTAAELQTISANPLAIVVTGPSGPATDAVAEPPGGLYVRADSYVFRLDPGDTASVRVYATRFGQPYAGATIEARFDPSQLQAGQGDPDVATPQKGITFPRSVVAGADGVATLPIEGNDPHKSRGYIDGQVYGVRPVLPEMRQPGVNYPFNQWNFISVLLWDTFSAGDPPTWAGLQPVFQQYWNLYPVMDGILDLSDYESVCEHRGLLLLAFGLDPSNPNSMPVTRDLSGAKRAAILEWLQSLGPDGKPLLGEPLPAPPERAPAPVPAAAAADDEAIRNGKAAAASRRLVLRSEQG